MDALLQKLKENCKKAEYYCLPVLCLAFILFIKLVSDEDLFKFFAFC